MNRDTNETFRDIIILSGVTFGKCFTTKLSRLVYEKFNSAVKRVEAKKRKQRG